MPKGHYPSNTLCWDCKHAVPDRDGEKGCSWSRRFIPVDGWVATPTTQILAYRGDTHHRYKQTDSSFIVHECPKFERG